MPWRAIGWDEVWGVCESGPVSRVLSLKAVIYLREPLPAPSSRQPGREPGQPIASLFALAPDGVCQADALLRRWCALTAPFQLFSRVARESSFLWHFPSGRPARPLAGILPCGARTFLIARPKRRAPRPSSPLSQGVIIAALLENETYLISWAI